jgi:PhnB protein
MATVNVYLTFNGNCEEAFIFYQSVLGGDFRSVNRFSEMPPSDDNNLTAEEQNRIMHISLPISAETALMGSDTAGPWGASFMQGNNFAITLEAESIEMADAYFQGLSTDGTVTMPMNHTFWGDYYGMFTDRFGIHWMVRFFEGQPAGSQA